MDCSGFATTPRASEDRRKRDRPSVDRARCDRLFGFRDRVRERENVSGHATRLTRSPIHEDSDRNSQLFNGKAHLVHLKPNAHGENGDRPRLHELRQRRQY